MYFDRQMIGDAGSVDISGANTGVFQPGQKVSIKRVIAVVTVAVTGAASTITFGVRPADGSSGTDKGTFDIPVAAVNELVYANLMPAPAASTGSDGSTVYTGGTTGLDVGADEELYLTSDGGASAGTVEFYVDYIPQGFDENDSGYTATEATVTLA